MNYWILKTEPQTFSWQDLEKEGKAIWDGVRNYEARNNLRKMKTDDLILIYHSGKNPGIIGAAKVIKEHYPDPTAKEGDWSAVDIIPVRKFKKMLLLQQLKQIKELASISLLKRTRLSVHSLSSDAYNLIIKLGN